MRAARVRRACWTLLPRVGDAADFYRRVLRNGYRLNELGAGTNAVIAGFDLEAEAGAHLRAQGGVGQRMHSDYCRVAGRTVNDWLADPRRCREFLAALEAAGWIERGAPAGESRFWRLIQGERAEMFGVFSRYEQQVIQDWMRGEVASADGAVVSTAATEGAGFRRPRSFRAQQKLDAARAPALADGDAAADF